MLLYGLSVIYMFGIDYISSLGVVSRHHADILLFQFPAQVKLFAVGMLLYILFEKLNNKSAFVLAFSGLLLIIFFNDNTFFNYALYPLCIGFIVIWLVYFIKQVKIHFDFSYSFYILHFPVIQLALYFEINPSNPLLSFMALFFIVLLLSYFSEKYIEKRFIQLGKNIIKRNKNATT